MSWIDKEEDAESSLGDFGVRKYDDQLGRFTSIDPLWEKYRSLTPYHYCANNPLIYVDPSGTVIEFAEGTSEEFKQGYQEARDYLMQSETGRAVIEYLEMSDQVFTIKEGKIGESQYIKSSNTIEWNPQEGIIVVDNNEQPVKAYDKDGSPVRPAQSPAIGLIHEMGHAYHNSTDPEGYDERREPQSQLEHWGNKEEKKVIQTIENKVVRELNTKAGRRQEVERFNHYTKVYPTKGPTTTVPDN